MATVSTMTAPQPQSGESEYDFTVRAHRELMQAVPNWEERNRIVWDAWDASFASPEREAAEKHFPPEQYVKKESVCYFPEHETAKVGPNGEPVVQRYDVQRLAKIAEENNGRIRERHAFPTLVDRHTMPPGTAARDPSPPRTLGAVGPFRIGMIGRDQPVFSLFADEYQRKDAQNDLKDRPGRSVEVLTLKANGRSYINPIAAISEAPRLPIPLQFSAQTDGGVDVERYQMMSPAAPAAPSGGNTFTKRFGADEPEQAQPPEMQESPTMALSDEDVRQVVEAILNTPPMQWAIQQMNQGGESQMPEEGTGGLPGAGGAQPPVAQPPAGPEAGGPPPMEQENNALPAVAGMAARAAAPAALGAMSGGGKQQYGGHMKQHYGGGLPHRYSANEAEEGEDVETEQYQALMNSQHELISELADTRARLFGLERDKADAERRDQLRSLQAKHPHFVDFDEECSRCLYSADNEMSDDEFERHVEMLEQYAARSGAITPMIPGGDDVRFPHQAESETERYAAQEAQVIRDLSAKYVNQGVVKSYDELKAEAREQLNG